MNEAKRMGFQMENSLSFLGESNAAEEAAQEFLDENIEIGNFSSKNDIDDSEISLPNTRKDVLNQVDLDEALQMVKQLHEVMAQLGEDESSHLLTTVYRKCLDLKAEKIELNSRQTGT